MMEARHFDLSDLAPVGYCRVSETGLILEANLTAATLLDAELGALVKRPFSRCIVKEDADIFYMLGKRLLQTAEAQACDLRMVRDDGTAFWVHLAARGAQEADGAPILHIVLTDISERKQAEAALRASNRRLRELSQRVIEAEDSVRRRINREVHDRVGANLSALSLSISMLMSKLPPEALRAAGARFEDTQRLLQETISARMGARLG